MGQVTKTQFGCVKTVEFTNAQLLTVVTDSPIILVPAIAGKIILVEAITCFFHWVANLTNIDDNTDVITADYEAGNNAIGPVSQNGIFAAGADRISAASFPFSTVVDTTPVALTNFIGGITLTFTNASAGDFTGGAVGNLLTVQVFYDVIPA